ncbi:MAG: LLM class flavin-dependent oxidoreductase [Dehalococcoidia bacterium]
MKVDLLYELPVDGASNRQAEHGTFFEALEQIELADQVGFSCLWEVEHHFLTEFSHSSAPEVFLSAVAQRTKNIGIGYGVVLLPYPFNHPIRVAERVATLDHLSNGRVEFGTGRSSEYEQGGFEISPQESRAMWQEAVRMIPRMWEPGPFEYQGRFFNIPARNVIPKPYQEPHPPMWMACTSPESWRLAGENGLGALGFSFVASFEEFTDNIRIYKDAIKEAEPVGKFINDQVGAFTMVLCGDDLEETHHLGFEACTWYTAESYRVLLSKSSSGGWRQLKDNVPFLKAMLERPDLAYKLMIEHNSIIVGDPNECLQKLKAYQERLQVDRVLCLMQMKGIPHEKVMRSIELFGEHVIPHFQESQSRVR